MRCNGKGCEKCQGGRVRLTECPLKLITAETIDFLELAKFSAEGILPEPGGLNSQTESFLQALRWFRDEEVRLKYR